MSFYCVSTLRHNLKLGSLAMHRSVQVANDCAVVQQWVLKHTHPHFYMNSSTHTWTACVPITQYTITYTILHMQKYGGAQPLTYDHAYEIYTYVHAY